MKFTLKKLTALLLSLLLVFSAVGIQALAADIVISETDYDYNIEYYIDYDGNMQNYVAIRDGNANLETLTIPETIEGYPVKKIYNYAFSNCKNLKSVSVPDTVECIGHGAFEGTPWFTAQPDGDLYLGKVYYTYKGIMPANTSIVIKDGTKGIAADAFVHNFGYNTNVRGLVNITLPDSLVCIADYAFLGCTELKSVTLPEGLKYIGESAFAECSSLKSFSIPDSVIKIRSTIVNDCASLESLYIGSGVSQIDFYPEVRDGGLSFSVSGCPNLKTLTVSPDNKLLRSINNCIIEKGTTTVVGGCAGSVIPTDGSVTAIGPKAFKACDGLKSITIPDCVESVGWSAFSQCPDLETINFGSGVTEITGNSMFWLNDSLKYLTVSPENPVYYSKDNCVINKSTKELVLGGALSVIPNDGSVTSIANDAFSGRKDLKKIIIPNSITKIAGGTFEYCTSLKQVTIPDSVTEIGYSAFRYCSSLAAITIPGSVEKIGNYAFDMCSKLEIVIIENGVKEIGEEAFSWCTKLKYIQLPESLTTIKDKAFINSDALESVVVPKSITSIGDRALGYDVIQPSDTPDKLIPNFKIYGYTNSAADVYAKENGIEFVSVGEVAPHDHIYGNWTTEKEATMFNAGVEIRKCTVCGRTERKAVDMIPSNEAVNEKTGITAVYPEGAYDYDDIELQAEKVTSGSVYDAVKANGSLARGEIIDISTTHNGEKVQPNEPVWIVVPIPDGYNADSLSVYFVNDDGTLEKVPSYVKDGYIYFEASHFSPYAIIDGSVKIDDVCDCMCHKTGFMGFIYKIMRIFWKIFKTNKTCDCGAIHY